MAGDGESEFELEFEPEPSQPIKKKHTNRTKFSFLNTGMNCYLVSYKLEDEAV